MKTLFFSTKIRMGILLSVLLITSFVSISIFNYNSAKEAVRNEIVSSSLPLLRDNIYSEIQEDLIIPVQVSSVMAHDSFLKNWSIAGEENSEEIVQYLKEIKEKYGFFTSFFVSEKTRKYYYYDGILKQVSVEDDHDDWFFHFREQQEAFVLDIDTNEAADDRLTIFINYRVLDYEGNFLGVTGVGIHMDEFSGFLKRKEDKYQRNIYLIDEERIIRAHSNLALLGKERIFDKSLNSIIHLSDALAGLPIDGTYNSEKGRMFYSARYLPQIQWFLVVEQAEENALKGAREILFRSISLGVLITVTVIFLVLYTIHRYQGRIEALAVTDELTKTSNRRELLHQFNLFLSRWERSKETFSLVMIDIDRFKSINDNKGHSAGDAVLVRLSEMLRESLRPHDIIARWGGDEFILLLDSDHAAALKTAERVKEKAKQIGKSFGDGEQELSVTISAGVATIRENEDFDSLLSRADAALYLAKQSGRNRIRGEA